MSHEYDSQFRRFERADRPFDGSLLRAPDNAHTDVNKIGGTIHNDCRSGPERSGSIAGFPVPSNTT